MTALLEEFDATALANLSRQLEAIPIKVQGYIALAALGWSQRKIAALFGVRQQTVFDGLSRWDSECSFRGDPHAVLAIRAANAENMADKFLWSITGDDIAALPADRRVKASETLMDRAHKLRVRARQMEEAREKKGAAGKYDAILDKLRSAPSREAAAHVNGRH
jgi:hypothetical protein